MRLADFIQKNHEPIIAEWESFAKTMKHETGALSKLALRDHISEILDAIVADMSTTQTEQEQTRKSKGKAVHNRMKSVSVIHAMLRIESGFKLDQLVAEYRALRATVLRLCENRRGVDVRELTRFNEAIDESLTEAASRFSKAMVRYRNQFVGILGHDLRNPLGAIMMTAEMMSRSDSLDARQAAAANRILNSAVRMNRMVRDLLDLTQGELQGVLPIKPASMDLAVLCREIVAELESFHPDRILRFESKGDLRGVWDGDRLAQVISNLVGNAVQHGRENTPIRITARAAGDHIALDVHNEGQAIPEAELGAIFEPYVRGPVRDDQQRSNSLGLGLYIAHQITLAHGGTIKVSSTDEDGTTFSVRIPRRARSMEPAKTPASSEHESRDESRASLH